MAHDITAADFHPIQDGGIMCLVMGQLQSDEDKPLGFTESFMLRPEGDSWLIYNSMFRLVVHNG